MRVLVVGGGPGGLYAALLLKKADPRRTVRVLERRERPATYGWGVVFSDQALDTLRDADLETFRPLVASFARWKAIDVWLEDLPRVRATGHGFAGISRHRLLAILQQRCADLGVELVFERAVEDVAELDGHDLVIAADGVRSRVRAAYAAQFGPREDARSAKFAWYGTTLRPEAFTYTVRRTPHGLVQATVYPFSDELSTCIVECSAATWSGLGFDRMTEAESLATCESLFADLLAGERLLSNESRWSSFITVRNRRWHHHNVVLIGDAAHTAHFSIGSGTRLAMDDAIALSEAIDRRPTLEAALAQYEAVRRPAVESLQEAAWESLRWFERLDRYAGLDAPQFAFNFVIRSGRITYDGVRFRDPGFADSVDRWFAGRARQAEAEVLLAPRPMHVPLTIGDVTIPNRAVVLQRGGGPAEEGAPGVQHARELTGLALSGAGLVMTDIVAVAPDGRITRYDACLCSEEHSRAWGDVVAAVRRTTPARIGIRIGHAGARAATLPRRHGLDRPLREDGWELLAASAVPYTRLARRPRAMTRPDMVAVRDAFAHAAEMASGAGFDLLELHMGHGYLLAGFISPLTNGRRDEYGGGLEGRLRFPLEVLGAVRRSWPRERPLAVAFSASDWAPGGLTERRPTVATSWPGSASWSAGGRGSAPSPVAGWRTAMI